MGMETPLDQKVTGTGYIFYVSGLLSTLRAVPHVLREHDCNLSPAHHTLITAWWKRTSNFKQHPEFDLIIRARNQILKDGSFGSYASSWEGTSEPGVVHYETAHYLDGERRDLEIDVRAALDWVERELANIEADLPPRYEEDDGVQEDTSAALSRLAKKGLLQKIAATMTTARIEDGGLISFSRRPQPWQDGDVIEIFHKPSGRTKLTATEYDGFRYMWHSNGLSSPVELEVLDDYRYRVIIR